MKGKSQMKRMHTQETESSDSGDVKHGDNGSSCQRVQLCSKQDRRGPKEHGVQT